MGDVSLEIKDGELVSITPYNAKFPGKARDLGGKFKGRTGNRGIWHFDARDADRVRDLLRQIYGTCGDPGEDTDLVTVRVRVRDCEDGQDAIFCGRTIARRPSRDEPVKLSPGVVLVEGSFDPSGGSVRYPAVAADDDVVVEVRDLPRAALAAADVPYEIAGETIDRTALVEEKKRPQERIAEIDALLSRDRP